MIILRKINRIHKVLPLPKIHFLGDTYFLHNLMPNPKKVTNCYKSILNKYIGSSIQLLLYGQVETEHPVYMCIQISKGNCFPFLINKLSSYSRYKSLLFFHVFFFSFQIYFTRYFLYSIYCTCGSVCAIATIPESYYKKKLFLIPTQMT